MKSGESGDVEEKGRLGGIDEFREYTETLDSNLSDSDRMFITAIGEFRFAVETQKLKFPNFPTRLFRHRPTRSIILFLLWTKALSALSPTWSALQASRACNGNIYPSKSPCHDRNDRVDQSPLTPFSQLPNNDMLAKKNQESLIRFP